MTTFNIPIGTSDPPSVCDGLPLLPVPAKRAGVAGSSSSNRILDISATILFSRLYLSAYFSYQMGICGPAVAFLFDNVTVATSNPNGTSGQLQLTFNNGQQIQAGGFIGCVVGGGVSIEQQLYLPSSYYSPWKFSWQTVFKFSLAFQIDFLALFVQLITYLLSKQGGKGVLSQDPDNTLSKYVSGLSTFSFVGASQNSGVSRQLRAEPVFTLPINILQYVPGLAQFLQALQKIKGELSFGPSFSIGMPVTLSIDRFDVRGGLAGADTASYDNLQYSGNQITATGPVPFNTGSSPSRLTTAVSYASGLSLGLSCHFNLTVCKLFSINFNSATLDMFRLMSLPAIVPSRTGSVSTFVSVPACLLEPEMSVAIFDVQNTVTPLTETFTGVMVKIGVILSNPYAGSTPGTVKLEINPPLDGFPTQVSVKPGQTGSELVTYTFANTKVVTGNPDDPGREQAPTGIADSQNYLIRGSMDPLSNQPCSDFESTVPLKVINRVLRAQPTDAQSAAPGPPWDPNAGLKLKGGIDASLPPANVPPVAQGYFSYPYAPGQAAQPTTFVVTIYDDKRQPLSSNNILMAVNGVLLAPRPSAATTLAPGTQGSPTSLRVGWTAKGPNVGYPTRFLLVLDGGALYGSMEYWLEVWNWQ